MSKRFLVLLAGLFAQADQSIPVHRVFQYESPDGTPFGSWKASINSMLSDCPPDPSNLTRKLPVCPIGKLDPNFFAAIIAARPSGLLVVLPDPELSPSLYRPFDLPAASSSASSLVANARAFERLLFESELKIPIYFTFDSADLQAAITTANNFASEETGTFATHLSAVVRTKEPPEAAPVIHNIHGFLGPVGVGSNKNVIALSTFYDAGGAVPSLAVGAELGVYNTAILLEVAHLLAPIAPDFNRQLLFIASGGGVLGYKGLEVFTVMNEKLMERVEFAMNLDRLTGTSIFAHSPRSVSDPEDELIETLETAFAFDNFPFSRRTSFEDADDLYPAWAHSRLLRQGIKGFTLSTFDEPEPLWTRASIFDRGFDSSLDIRAARAATTLSRSLAFNLLPHTRTGAEFQSSDVIESLLGSPDRIAQFRQMFQNISRAHGALTESKIPAVISAIQKDMNLSLRGVQAEKAPLRFVRGEADPKFFYPKPLELQVQVTKPPLFDVALFLPIALSFAILYFVIPNAFADNTGAATKRRN